MKGGKKNSRIGPVVGFATAIGRLTTEMSQKFQAEISTIES